MSSFNKLIRHRLWWLITYSNLQLSILCMVNSQGSSSLMLAQNWTKTESVNAVTTLWSPRWEQWVWERGVAASEAKNTHSSLEKPPYPCVQCSSKLHSHPQTLSIRYTLPSFSLFTLHGRPSHKHMPRLLTVVTDTCWFKGHWDVHEAYTANT